MTAQSELPPPGDEEVAGLDAKAVDAACEVARLTTRKSVEDIIRAYLASARRSSEPSGDAPAPAAEPVLYVSAEQLNSLEPDRSDNSGQYLPVRRTPSGKFQQPLYTAPAPAAVTERLRDQDAPMSVDLEHAVKVKALVWSDDTDRYTDNHVKTEGNKIVRWTTDGTFYRIKEHMGDERTQRGFCMVWYGDHPLFGFDNLETARAAAQAHWERHVLSSIEPVGAPAAVTEALRAIVEAIAQLPDEAARIVNYPLGRAYQAALAALRAPAPVAVTEALSLSDPLVILAGIKQFGLAPDGSDLRDLEAALRTPAPADDEVKRLREALDVVRLEARQRENLPLPSAIKGAQRGTAMALSARLAKIERLSKAALTNGGK